MPATTFPARLRALREQAGYTQEELGAICDRSKQWVAQMESDSYTYTPRRETITLLSGALSCEPLELDPSWSIAIPPKAVVLRPDTDVPGLFRPWRDEDRKRVGESIDHTELGNLTTLLRGHGLGLYLLP